MRGVRVSGVVVLLLLAGAGTTRACPDCEPGRAARRQIAGEGLAAHLAVAALPFVAVGLASLWAERIGKRR